MKYRRLGFINRDPGVMIVNNYRVLAEDDVIKFGAGWVTITSADGEVSRYAGENISGYLERDPSDKDLAEMAQWERHRQYVREGRYDAT